MLKFSQVVLQFRRSHALIIILGSSAQVQDPLGRSLKYLIPFHSSVQSTRIGIRFLTSYEVIYQIDSLQCKCPKTVE